MKIDITKWEIGILFFLAIWFQFAATNVNSTLGLIYSVFCLIAAVFIIIDPKRQIHLKKGNDSTFGALAKGAGAYIVLIVVGQYIIIPGINAIRSLLASTTPALATNLWVNNFNFGVAIPIAETLCLFAVALDILSDVFNVKLGPENLVKLKTWFLVVGLSFAFMLFHISAKGVQNLDTLVIVFFMAIISLVLIIWDKSYESAVYFHILANILALIT